MKNAIAAIVLLVAAATGTAQQIPPNTGDRVYTSPDGVFRFTYPAFLRVRCTPGNENAYCKATLVRVVWPVDYLYKGYDFAGADFAVGVAMQRGSMAEPVSRVTSKRDCLSFHTYSRPVTTIVINGISFATISRGGAAGGTVTDFRLFRSFHQGVCYELVTAISIANGGYDDEDYASGRVKRFTKQDTATVQKTLDRIVKSFRFLK